MKIENLKIFLTVARVLNIHKAADELFLSHQNLSFIIKNMEKELGMTLFTRGKKGLQLTTDGYDFLQVAEPIVSSYDAFLKAKATKNQTIVIELYTTPTLASFLSGVQEVNRLKHLDNHFLSLHKRNVNEIAELLERKQQGVFLLPICNGYPQVVSQYEEKQVLLYDPLAVIVHQTHPLASRVMVSAREVNLHPLIRSSYYQFSVENPVVLNVDNLTQCKKIMKERDFCYSGTRWIYERFFEPEGEWCVLNIPDGPRMDVAYALIVNLPAPVQEIVSQNVVSVLSSIFQNKAVMKGNSEYKIQTVNTEDEN